MKKKPRVEITSYGCQDETCWKADCPELHFDHVNGVEAIRTSYPKV